MFAEENTRKLQQVKILDSDSAMKYWWQWRFKTASRFFYDEEEDAKEEEEEFPDFFFF